VSDLSIKAPGVLSGYRVHSRSLKFLKLPLEDVAVGWAGVNEVAGRIHESSAPSRTPCSNDATGLEATNWPGIAAQRSITILSGSRRGSVDHRPSAEGWCVTVGSRYFR
jgi:hypothetical protein